MVGASSAHTHTPGGTLAPFSDAYGVVLLPNTISQSDIGSSHNDLLDGMTCVHDSVVVKLR